MTAPTPHDSPYQIDRLPQVDEHLRALGERAARLGILDEYLNALKHAIHRLQAVPLTWGDPAYHTRREGGVVCHAIAPPLVFHYVVFEPERVVCILKVKPLPGHALETEEGAGGAPQ
jgi:hypothetical protein